MLVLVRKKKCEQNKELKPERHLSICEEGVKGNINEQLICHREVLREVDNSIKSLNENNEPFPPLEKKTPRANKRWLPTDDGSTCAGPLPKKTKVEGRKSERLVRNSTNALNENDHEQVSTRKIKKGRKTTPRAATEKRPAHSSRYDGAGHSITFNKDRQRCKKEGCNYKSFGMCVKCNVHLCSKKRNCFQEFHELNLL